MIHQQHHHFVAHILQLLAGGGLGLLSAALAHRFGARSADRLPGESRLPQCFFCLRPLSWQECSPLFSWLLRPDTLAFPCPCGLRRGMWPQPTSELIGFIFGLLAVEIGGWGPEAVPAAIGLGLMAALAVIDFNFGIIPDELNIFLALLGGWWTYVNGNELWLSVIVAGALLTVGLFCAIAYSRWRKQEMLGLGDVKFFAAAGLWLQPDIAAWFLVGGGFLGGVIGILWQRLGGGKAFPFAPALCLSLAGCVFYQMIRAS